MILLALAALLCSDVRYRPEALHQRCDRLELNIVIGPDDKRGLEQYIFWLWCEECGRHAPAVHRAGSCGYLVAHHVHQLEFVDGRPRILWFDRLHNTWRYVTADSFALVYSTYDRELEARHARTPRP